MEYACTLSLHSHKHYHKTFAGISNRSSDSEGSKEYVEFNYNPVYRDTDPEDVDPQAGSTCNQPNIGHDGSSQVNGNYQETSFTEEAEIHKNEGFELPEVGSLGFSPRHLWARTLSPDLSINKGIELAEEWVGSKDTVVSQPGPDCLNTV